MDNPPPEQRDPVKERTIRSYRRKMEVFNNVYRHQEVSQVPVCNTLLRGMGSVYRVERMDSRIYRLYRIIRAGQQRARRGQQPAGREQQPAEREEQRAGREEQPAGREEQQAGREEQRAEGVGNQQGGNRLPDIQANIPSPQPTQNFSEGVRNQQGGGRSRSRTVSDDDISGRLPEIQANVPSPQPEVRENFAEGVGNQRGGDTSRMVLDDDIPGRLPESQANIYSPQPEDIQNSPTEDDGPEIQAEDIQNEDDGGHPEIQANIPPAVLWDDFPSKVPGHTWDTWVRDAADLRAGRAVGARIRGIREKSPVVPCLEYPPKFYSCPYLAIGCKSVVHLSDMRDHMERDHFLTSTKISGQHTPICFVNFSTLTAEPAFYSGRFHGRVCHFYVYCGAFDSGYLVSVFLIGDNEVAKKFHYTLEVGDGGNGEIRPQRSLTWNGDVRSVSEFDVVRLSREGLFINRTMAMIFAGEKKLGLNVTVSIKDWTGALNEERHP